MYNRKMVNSNTKYLNTFNMSLVGITKEIRLIFTKSIWAKITKIINVKLT